MYRILAADDDPTSLLVLRRAIERAGHEVRTVTDGATVVEVAREYQPDLILLDVTMPNQDGFTACRSLRAQEATADIPVIFVTAASHTEQVLQAFSAGGRDYITKPFTMQEVLARINVHVRLRRTEEELRLKNNQLLGLNNELVALCRMDPLTKLLNRRAWDEKVIEEHDRYLRQGRPYSVVMIDVDHFKTYNDSHGHQAGDACLRRIAEAIVAVCRRVDSVGRYGGEEFVVLAPETAGEKALKLADRIRRGIWGLAIPQAAGVSTARVTASVGVAVSDQCSWEDVLRRADDALYVAKRAGRNMVFADQGRHAKAGAVSATSTVDSPAQTAGNDEINVLVVDDDATNRAVCKGCLQRVGYRIREAADGRLALAQIAEEAPDVVVMDVMMPNMDGLECTRTIRADPDTRDIPIIIVSALARTEDILAGLEAGADEYLSKPIRASELILRVQSMTRLHRERHDLLVSYEARGRQMRILTRLVEFCRSVSNGRTINELLRHTVEAVADVVDCRRVSIMLPDESNQFLRIASALGLAEELVSEVKTPIGEPTAGRVFTSGEAIVVNSLADTGSGCDDYSAPYFASVPLISAPLEAAGLVVGVLNATERAGQLPFEPRDLEYIELISKVTGTAIHDLRMREARDQASDSIMVALAKLAEYRDNDTGRHLDRVTKFCLILAETLRRQEEFREEINDEFLYNLERSVPLHDIGKVAIPDAILLFPGRLTEEQMAVMRTHADTGANTIESLIARAPGVCFLEMATKIARYHHERFDGQGYPTGLSGKMIPLAARITSVADVYDALTTRRVYKEAYSHDKAMEIILQRSGTQFDPEVVEAFRQREKDFAALAEAMADDFPSRQGVARRGSVAIPLASDKHSPSECGELDQAQKNLALLVEEIQELGALCRGTLLSEAVASEPGDTTITSPDKSPPCDS